MINGGEGGFISNAGVIVVAGWEIILIIVLVCAAVSVILM